MDGEHEIPVEGYAESIETGFLFKAKSVCMNCVCNKKKQFIYSYNCMRNILEIREGFMQNNGVLKKMKIPNVY